MNKNEKQNIFYAMEWGFKACERGINLEKAKEELEEILEDD